MKGDLYGLPQMEGVAYPLAGSSYGDVSRRLQKGRGQGMKWFRAWRKKRACFHHDTFTGESWIDSRLVNMGSGKRFICRECGKVWFV